ncbi:SEFIR domain-containing protein [Stomatobaculum longum]|jgi:SEFIR domain family|uniref:SEFIR domain-containing protein n=1 Tax=Stomatobaculum longum TaxID=796942 RepID=UPI0028F040B8|nr:SEFIR domain-containing protein [Stomatobaculum longum]
MADNPKVFISYAHKSQEYEDDVLTLANRLRADGIDAMIDQYEETPIEGWPRWMEKQIATADFVVILCDETYYNKLYSDKKGKGVVWEASIVYQMLYDSNVTTTKFVAAFFKSDESQYIPLPLKAFTYYDLSDSTQYDKLYWRFRGVTNKKKPPLGELKPLPEKKRKTMLFSTPIDIEKWDKAKWRGIVYLWCGDAPGLGLFYENYAAGKMIFYEWKNNYDGLEFADDFLKVDYIIPPFPENCWIYREPQRNYGKGYFVHIGSNIDACINRVETNGMKLDEVLFTTLARYQWMDEAVGSQNRDQFISSFHKEKKYYLLPVGLNDPSGKAVIENMQFDFDCAIPMKSLRIIEGKRLDTNDVCSVVLKKAEEQRYG